MIATKQIKTRLGRDYTVVDDANFIKRHFGAQGSSTYQINNLKFLKKIRSHYNLIIDVGANWGMNTVEYAQFSDSVVSFEPYPDLYQLLLKNIQQNGCEKQVETYPYALHHSDIRYAMSWHHNGLSNRYNPTKGAITVDSRCLDDFNLQPDVIKIDTEGTEWYVIQGADRTIQRHRPICQIELDRHWIKYGINIQDLFDYFLDQDYVCVDKKHKQYRSYEKVSRQMDRFFIPRETYDAIE